MAGILDGLRVGMDKVKYKHPAAPVHLKREWIFNTPVSGRAYEVPAGAGFVLVSGIGCGQGMGLRDGGGWGGVFAQGAFKVNSRESLTLFVADGIDTEVRRGKTPLFIAPMGADGSKGRAIGFNVRQGKAPIYQADASGVVRECVGGDAGNDYGLPISFHIGGTGGAVYGNGKTPFPATGFGGGGARRGSAIRQHTQGVLILDFYTTDPRGKTI